LPKDDFSTNIAERHFKKITGEIHMAVGQIMVRLGNLVPEGDASPELLECLSRCEFPLAGVVKESPYVRGGNEILENFSQLIPDCYACLVKTEDIISVLEKDRPRAVAEIKEKYPGWIYLPFRKRFCERRP
jgi:hypothetical protein